ncbi:MAG: cardiolipin synthase [Firmicutes bacterium]|nr:cardiolipin synthase [Bacillota bacterium]
MLEKLKKGFHKVFNPMTITGILILIQAVYVWELLFNLTTYSPYISLIITVGAVIMALYIIWRDDNPAYKMGWLMTICLMPILGALLYLFYGNKRPAKPLIRKLEPCEKKHRKDLEQTATVEEIECPRLAGISKYLSKHGPYPAWGNTQTTYYALGDDAYPRLLADLEKAEHSIFMEYFIISEGEMWHSIFDILKRKAAQGVDVRLMYDDVGTLPTMPKAFVKELRAAGIKVHAFNPLRPIISLVYNNRDHRKMAIIDSYICHTGGYNLADEYINKEVRFGHWKDTGLRLEGDAVWNYTVMFLTMWNAFVPTEESFESFRPHVHHPEAFVGNGGIVQPYSDTPLDEESVGENVYLEILNQAKDYTYIFTPYLVIDNEMVTALSMAAKRGVDVRLVTPGIPDKKMVFKLTRSYYRPLIKAGVRIYEYTPGFIHAKSFISDDQVGVVGTINMDYRSLYLHFECATMMIGCEALKDLKQDCFDTFEKSDEILMAELNKNFFSILFEGLLRALSPMM